MISLRRRLILSLWAALVVVGLLSAVFTYDRARREADILLDYQMEQIAHFLVAQSFNSSAPTPVYPKLDLDHDTEDDFVVTVDSADGKSLYRSRPDWKLASPDWLGFRDTDIDGTRYRVYSAKTTQLRIVIAQQLETRREIGTGAAFDALLPVLLLIPILGIVLGAVSQQLLKPLRTVAHEVAGRPPLSLVPLSTIDVPSEMRPLIDEINELLGRLQIALEQEQRFIADAAHALRTPLTALQLQADVLDGSDDPAERSHRLSELRAGIRRASLLAEHLLALARSSHAPTTNMRCDVDGLLTDLCAFHAPLAAAGGHGLELGVTSSAATVCCDPRLLSVLIGNLIDNALRYTPVGGEVVLNSLIENDDVVVEIVDQGPGLPENELDKVFERFYRAPGDLTEGSGLGLSAARSIAEGFGGSVQLRNRSDASGLIASVRLPRALRP